MAIRSDLQRRLFNYIVFAMQAHDMSLTDLEDVVDEICKLYKKEATLPHPDDMTKPLEDV